ncbi:MAG: hypothetical protein ACI936_001666 [Paraglaciecola sp.]
MFSRGSLIIEQSWLLNESKEWRNIAFFASLLVNPIETFKIIYYLAVLNATLGHFVLAQYTKQTILIY